MDEFGERNALLEITPAIYDRKKKENKTRELGQIDIFSMGGNENKEVQKTEPPEVLKASRTQVFAMGKGPSGNIFL